MDKSKVAHSVYAQQRNNDYMSITTSAMTLTLT